MATKKTSGQPSLTATPKKQGKGAPKKDGLRKPQVRVLVALSKAKQPLSRAEISKKGEVDSASLTEVIGSSDKETQLKNDKRKGWKSLVTLGHVKVDDKDGTAVYSITASGKKALEAANK